MSDITELSFSDLSECAELLKNLDETSVTFFEDVVRIRNILSYSNDMQESGTGVNMTQDNDKKYLQSVIDGNVDFYDSEIFEKLNEMYDKYEKNFEMFSIIEKAIERYSQFAMSL